MSIKMDTKRQSSVDQFKNKTTVNYDTWTYKTSGNVEHIVFLKVETHDSGKQVFHIKCENARHAHAVFNQLTKAHIYG